ncbi:MAG: epoxyqueuosine reductase QueH [Bacillales bacterium]|jgi:predicted adenine nucleotide alpha hydrolase (AANH) superfamily ATPase|nr:epoxyqueuosine reductase QueH [Bacillales bacterium]
MKPQNYYQQMLKTFKEVSLLEKKPSLLLHSCCAPCNCYVMAILIKYFEITLYFNNSNIYEKEEYEKRLEELERYLSFFNKENQSNIKMIIEPYEPLIFDTYLNPLKEEKEGAKRCYVCYYKRLEQNRNYALKNNFAYFTTVMSISRRKNNTYLNEIGTILETKELNFLLADFKKDGGQEKGIEISKQFKMYRQTFCGCKYSKKY